MKKEKRGLSVKDFNHIYSRVPRVCVEVILENKGEILLTKRKIQPDAGKWHFPGGTVRFEESLRDAVKRVAKSELGIDVKIKKQLGVIEFLRKSYHPVSIAFLVKGKPGKIKLNFQASEFKFFKKIPGNTVKEHFKFIKNYLKEKGKID